MRQAWFRDGKMTYWQPIPLAATTIAEELGFEVRYESPDFTPLEKEAKYKKRLNRRKEARDGSGGVEENEVTRELKRLLGKEARNGEKKNPATSD